MGNHGSPELGRTRALGPPQFELHSLGWRAFQDLCAAILREVWGQSVQSFADTNDAGRDGAFYGIWNQDPKGNDLPNGPFVIQCKFFARSDQTISLSSITSELSKIKALVSRGLCNSYVLMTNARVTGRSEEEILKAISAQRVNHPLIFAESWVNQTIAANQRLRMFVPRVYGLGDLSYIIDDRAYNQARALLDYLRDDLSTFVVTDAYSLAVEALLNHGFCLLLGEPGVGKSAIAATLAMVSLDKWHCLTTATDSATDFATHWNPNDRNQFFWVDDAFGTVRHERARTDDWARRLPMLMAAIDGGAKVVFTSRDYIYREARPLLREYAFPLFREQQVTVDVARLSRQEREQILYNHIRLGNQSAAVRRRLKPYLADAADSEPFWPEAARRLGREEFTAELRLSRASIRNFIAKPNGFLVDVFRSLDPDHIGALALVYREGELLVPPQVSSVDVQNLLSQVGAVPQHVAPALTTLEGTFLRCAPKPGALDGRQYWTFKHPTLREGFASYIARMPNLVDVLISGLEPTSVLRQLDCGSGRAKGRLIIVPESLYSKVAEKVASTAQPDWLGNHREAWYQWTNFLASRSSDRFLEVYLSVDPEALTRCVNFTSYINTMPQIAVLARCQKAGLLPLDQRLEVARKISNLAVEVPDATWMDSRDCKVLVHANERVAIRTRIHDELVPRLDELLAYWTVNESADLEQYYSMHLYSLSRYAKAFRNQRETYRSFLEAIEAVQERINYQSSWDEDDDWQHETYGEFGQDRSTRSVFQDVDK
jgi:hypothetical protein